MYEISIINGHVVDGTGNPWYKADIGIKDGRIDKIGKLEAYADEIIDANGLIISPGFIDMHTHSDLSIIVNPLAESKIRQGVTTEVIGNCGSSSAYPLKDGSYKEEIKKRYGIDIDWTTLKGYKNRIEKQGIALNIVPLVGLGTISTYIIDNRTDGPNEQELDDMKQLLHEAMKDGAFGASNGNEVWNWAKRCDQRLIELISVLREYNGIYTTHKRNEGDNVIDSVLEEIKICEITGVPCHISHHKHNGYENWGTVSITLELIDKARKRGIDITLDQYPYTATGHGLLNLLPPWIRRKQFLERVMLLKNKNIRKKIKREQISSVSDGTQWYSQLKNSSTGDYMSIMISSISDKNKNLLGKIIGKIAIDQGIDQWDFTFNLLSEEENVGIIRFSFSEEDIKTVMKHNLTMFGSDGSALAPYGVLSKGHPHPRNYGTYPRILGKYVREEKVISIEEAIRKMTSYPAQRLRINNRGLIQEDKWADIVIFDPFTIIDKATYEEPKKYPEGIEYVIVNGKIVIAEGEHQKVLPGRVIQRKI